MQHSANSSVSSANDIHLMHRNFINSPTVLTYLYPHPPSVQPGTTPTVHNARDPSVALPRTAAEAGFIVGSLSSGAAAAENTAGPPPDDLQQKELVEAATSVPVSAAAPAPGAGDTPPPRPNVRLQSSASTAVSSLTAPSEQSVESPHKKRPDRKGTPRKGTPCLSDGTLPVPPVLPQPPPPKASAGTGGTATNASDDLKDTSDEESIGNANATFSAAKAQKKNSIDDDNNDDQANKKTGDDDRSVSTSSSSSSASRNMAAYQVAAKKEGELPNLPRGWEAIWDSLEGRFSYRNSDGTRQQDRPGSQAPAASSTSAGPALPPNWVSFDGPDGTAYYNRVTKAFSNDLPSESPSASALQPASVFKPVPTDITNRTVAAAAAQSTMEAQPTKKTKKKAGRKSKSKTKTIHLDSDDDLSDFYTAGVEMPGVKAEAVTDGGRSASSASMPATAASRGRSASPASMPVPAAASAAAGGSAQGSEDSDDDESDDNDHVIVSLASTTGKPDKDGWYKPNPEHPVFSNLRIRMS